MAHITGGICPAVDRERLSIKMIMYKVSSVYIRYPLNAGVYFNKFEVSVF